MSAGAGIRHSEFNASKLEPVHFLQIWILPERKGLVPSYEQRSFDTAQMHGKLRLIGSRSGRDGSVTIHQDVDLFATRLGRGEGVSHKVATGHGAWVQVVRGAVTLEDERVVAGDGAAIAQARTVRLEAVGDAEVLLFDMATHG